MQGVLILAKPSDNNVTKRLQQLFKITTKFNKDSNKTDVHPAYVRDGDLAPAKFTTDVQKIFKEWKNDLVGTNDLKDRFQRYSDLDFMCENCGYIGIAVKLYSNETICPDESGKILHIHAKEKDVEKYINEFLPKIGINRQILEDTSYGIAKFADHFWIRAMNPEEGITEIIPVDVKQVKDRLEFSAIDILNKQYDKNQWTSNMNSSVNIDDMVDAITTKVKSTDYAEQYRKYLFGYTLGEDRKNVLPPWAISHFRRFSSQSEFAPFGRPLLISSLSIFREYKSALNLLAMARVAKFPKEVFKIQIDENMTPTERVLAVDEARQEYLNLVTQDNGKEDYGIGSSIWTIKDLFEYELIQNTMDLGDVADVELLLNELIASTLVPKGYLIPGDSWGESGKALLHQSKIFAREVYTNQSAILSELTDLIKTQFVIMNLFDGENTEFELSLAFPNSEQTSENISNQKDTMELAQAVMDNLKTALAIDSIPTDVAKDIFKKYSSIDQKDLDKWIKSIEASVDLQIRQPDPEEPKFMESVQRKLKNMNEDVFRVALFEAKKKLSFNEGTMNGQHFMFNNTISQQDKLKFEVLRSTIKGKSKLQE